MIPRTLRLTLSTALILCLFPAITIAHPGGLDAYGCHKNRKAGVYECYKGEFAGRSFASRGEMLANRQVSYTAIPPILPAQQFSGTVVRIKDGDTIFVQHNGHAEEIRLNGIYCPEKDQSFGTEATKFVSQLVLGKEVMITSFGFDKFERTLGDVVLSDGTNVNQEMVRAGLAWWYRKFSQDQALAQLESEAQVDKRGLWANANPMPPWEWRKLKREGMLGGR